MQLSGTKLSTARLSTASPLARSQLRCSAHASDIDAQLPQLQRRIQQLRVSEQPQNNWQGYNHWRHSTFASPWAGYSSWRAEAQSAESDDHWDVYTERLRQRLAKPDLPSCNAPMSEEMHIAQAARMQEWHRRAWQQLKDSQDK